MLGFVAVLSSALLGIVLVFVIMLVSFISAQLAPTEGEYKLEYADGLLFPIDTFLLTEEVMVGSLDHYMISKGQRSVEVSTTCTYGGRMDKFTADRYTSYNYIFMQSFFKRMTSPNVALVERSGVLLPSFNPKSSRCFLWIKSYNPRESTSELKNKIEDNSEK